MTASATCKSILVVDDDLEFLNVLVIALKHECPSFARLDRMTNAADAITALTSNHYDLVLTDVILSGHGTGYDVWRTAKSRNVECILMSSVVRPSESGRIASKDDVIQQPSRYLGVDGHGNETPIAAMQRERAAMLPLFACLSTVP